jgi:addiction module HigA family antidote
MNISAYQLAKGIFIDQTRISEIIRGKRAVIMDTALRFARFFGTTPEFWINIQTQYDLEKKRAELAAGRRGRSPKSRRVMNVIKEGVS